MTRFARVGGGVPRWSRFGLLAATAVVLTGAAACGGTAHGSVTPTPIGVKASPAAGGTPRAGAQPGSTLVVCHLVSRAEMELIVGPLSREPRPAQYANKSPGRLCVYTRAAGPATPVGQGPTSLVIVVIAKPDLQAKGDRRSPAQYFDALVAKELPAGSAIQDISGLGDKAKFATNGKTGGLVVLRGETLVAIQGRGLDLGAAKAIAAKALARL